MPKPLAEVAKNKGIEQSQGIYDKQFLPKKVLGQHSESMSTVVGALWMTLSLVRKVLLNDLILHKESNCSKSKLVHKLSDLLLMRPFTLSP